MRKYKYPRGLICSYFLESMANNGVSYNLKRGKGKYLAFLKTSTGDKVCIFGGGIRVSSDAEDALERAQEELQKKQQTELFYIE